MRHFLRNNALSLSFLGLFLLTIAGQVYCGLQEYNKELIENGGLAIELSDYWSTGHFIESTFENWESEFLQMALFVLLTIKLMQKGSSESKDFNKVDDTDREPDPHRKGAPWPVKAGGWILAVYKHSLSGALLILFGLSFAAHFYGSLKDENVELAMKGEPLETASQYIIDSRFWFESFQNWQSEFLSVFAIIVLSVYLREKGSPQSKPVDAPNSETGE